MNKRIATTGKIVDLKKRLRDSAESAYRSVLQERQHLFDQLYQLRQVLESAESRMAASANTNLSVLELQSWNDFIELTRSQILQQEEEIRQFDVMCEGKRADLVERYVDEKKWQEYQTRLSTIHVQRIQRDEQKQMDELAVQRSTRAFV